MTYRPDISAPDIRRELERVADELREPRPFVLQFQQLYAAPQNPQVGMLAWADGTSWNPGAGAGLYEYRGGAWNKV